MDSAKRVAQTDFLSPLKRAPHIKTDAMGRNIAHTRHIHIPL